MMSLLTPSGPGAAAFAAALQGVFEHDGKVYEVQDLSSEKEAQLVCDALASK